MTDTLTDAFPATRAAGLARLAVAAAGLGRDYADGRNTDAGPDQDPTTSVLSPYLRRRMVMETEVVEAARAAHGPAAEKFVQEVFWRTYFKGHLETRPLLWTAYQRLVAEGHERLAREPGLRKAYDRAVAGRTGIDCFDDWALELAGRNWLHNHARMWFASIWVFTLRLPWALGAELFLQNLVDGDPASNTLSWRWVAGLHTRGKAYAARAENIRRYTNGRYDPQGLNEDPVPLEEPDGPAPVKLPRPDAVPDGSVALLLHLEDLHPESLPLGCASVRRVGGLVAHADGAVERVRAMDRAAMADALDRAARHFGCSAGLVQDGWNEGLPVVTAWAPVRPSASALPPAIRVRRAWDDAVWPRATKGYFQVKAVIPGIIGPGPDGR
jgi:deoxyribodipyrimidine photo-lyase